MLWSSTRPYRRWAGTPNAVARGNGGLRYFTSLFLRFSFSFRCVFRIRAVFRPSALAEYRSTSARSSSSSPVWPGPERATPTLIRIATPSSEGAAAALKMHKMSASVAADWEYATWMMANSSSPTRARPDRRRGRTTNGVRGALEHAVAASTPVHR
jgi:hypothetical protein